MITDYPVQIYFLELHMEIIQQLLPNNKNMLLVKVYLYQKILLLKTGSRLQSCKMTDQKGVLFYLHKIFQILSTEIFSVSLFIWL